MSKKLLERLKKGNTVYGTCITSVAPLWPKAARSAGLDFVFLDSEHVPLERMEIASMCQVYASMGIAPLVRIASPDPFKACQIMDAGAEGVIAPYIENAAQIKEMVGAIKYRPLKGNRLQTILKDPETIEPVLKNYLENHNRGNLCIVNIESVPAIENLDELLNVPGLDGVFIGPHDLSVSMGIPESYDDPGFETVVRLIIEKCRSRGLSAGIHFSELPERQVKWMKEGANIIIHSSDIAIFSQKLIQDIKLIKNDKDEGPLPSSENIII